MHIPRQRAAENKQSVATSFALAAAELVDGFRDRRPLRAGSLLVSVFGDAIAPRGGTVWLGSLIRALEGFGVNQRLVRTSVFRLVRDGWLTNEQIGRRSYYSLTEAGHARITRASRRIYGAPPTDWPGVWTLVLLSGLPATARDAIRKELAWLGFAPFSTSLLAHPAADSTDVADRLRDLPGQDRLLIMRARADDGQTDYLDELVHSAWALDDIDGRYAEFLQRFAPVYRGARRARRMPPEHAFQARTLLIHEYRKIILRDPQLPLALLPKNWNGLAAYELCRDLYALISDAAELYLTSNMETATGALPTAEPASALRFASMPG